LTAAPCGALKMPLLASNPDWFPIETANPYGRTMVATQMKMHNDMWQTTKAKVEHEIEPKYMKVMDILHRAERFRPSYNQQKEKADDDIVMANLIRDATTRCEDHLDAHVLRFRELRKKCPNHLPSWNEQTEIDKQRAAHNNVVKKATKWVDDEPPHEALHYRKVLRRTMHTKGGFLRQPQSPKKRRRPGGNNSPASLLPIRRSRSMADGEVSPQAWGEFEKDVEAGLIKRTPNAPVPPTRRRPHWSLTGALSTMTFEDHAPQHSDWRLIPDSPVLPRECTVGRKPGRVTAGTEVAPGEATGAPKVAGTGTGDSDISLSKDGGGGMDEGAVWDKMAAGARAS